MNSTIPGEYISSSRSRAIPNRSAMSVLPPDCTVDGGSATAGRPAGAVASSARRVLLMRPRTLVQMLWRLRRGGVWDSVVRHAND